MGHTVVGITKDPRPIREKSWQISTIRGLISFLVQAGYPNSISVKTMQAPSAKDFQSIFKFLYGMLDSQYVYQKKFEEEVPLILKSLRYPFADGISKSQLFSVGSPHAWPTLLAVLAWLQELIQCCEQAEGTYHGTNDDFQTGMVGAEVPNERIFYNYLLTAYGVFLSGEDDNEEMDQHLIKTFDRRNAHIVKDLERMRAHYAALRAEWEPLSMNEDPLSVLQRDHHGLVQDREKFRQYLSHLDTKVASLTEQLQQVREDANTKASELTQLQEQQRQLQHVVDTQEVSPADVDRMTSEKTSLAKGLDTLALRSEEATRVAWEHEIALQKKIDTLDKLVQEYNGLGRRLNLFASRPDLQLSLLVHNEPPKLLLSVDLQNLAKPAIHTMLESFNAKAHALEDERIAISEELDQLQEAFSEQSDANASLSQQLRQQSDEHTSEKETIGRNNATKTHQIQHYEQSMTALRGEDSDTLLAVQQRHTQLNTELQQMSRTYVAEKERLSNKLVTSMQDALSFHAHIMEALHGLKQKVKLDYVEATSSSPALSA
ncbi:hypothetical protein CXG81DRAFT_15246 [Caulochytrium protostelioides]|uniref:Kinetochore protein NDC80 n=1 Tax=Caulochytrium protostelioides TaxID=1555241 RepID=A0A4P9X1D4_9FUNG|nr:hypothetical protein CAUPRSCDRAFT_6102 [Caulochytrium protostelioides]RKO98942.1 hypothetical protein CXG81DRAFT_15246 [Caulochytrium protostelioides]|eukprot:RKO98942.1 hypothetical protein CXG81DRAFT_15246 [Caulochytrium protostelioides]